MSAGFLHCTATLLSFVINKCFVRRYSETMRAFYDEASIDGSRLTQILLLRLPNGNMLIQSFLLQLQAGFQL